MTIDLYWAPNYWADGGVGIGPVYWAQNYWANADDGAPPTSPAGAGAFELSLDGEATVTYTWQSGVEKHRDGSEKRSNVLDDPAVRYEGQALLLGPVGARGAQSRAARTRLARFGALGTPFLLGLPFEALALRADSLAFDVAVFSGALALADWAVPGVRVIVQHKAYGSTQAVIQSVTSDSLNVLTDNGSPLGDVGRLGATIMPAASIFLDAQQGFARYCPIEPVETWQIRARNADRGFSESPVAASLALAGIFSGLTIVARTPGADGNAITISYFGGGINPVGDLSETTNHVEFQYQTSVTTIADFINAFNSSLIVKIEGTVGTPSTVIGPGNLIDTVPLTGGVDGAPIEVGIGATLVEYRGKNVWNRRLVIDGTITDSIQTMNDPIDLGGLPFTSQTASVPDWARSIGQHAPLGPEWQWAKRMLWAIAGSWRTFWLPTWRRDLIVTATGTGTVTVTDGEASGDVRTWYPEHRRDLQVLKTDGSVVYVRIVSALDNGDGTTTLSVVDEADAPVTVGAAAGVRALSWLELVRLESDSVPVTFRSREFELAVQGRVVQYTEEDL